MNAQVTTFANKFNFKKINNKAFAKLYDEYSNAGESKADFYSRISSEYDLLVEGSSINAELGQIVNAAGQVIADESTKVAKRKAVELTLTEPTMLAVVRDSAIPQDEKDLTIDLVQKLVAEYVKLNFIDAFQPVGDYGLNAIIAFRAATGGRSSALDEKLLEDAVKSFTDFMTAALQNPEAGAMLGKIANARFTSSAIARNGLVLSEETARKLQARVDQWGLHINDNEPDRADEFGAVYGLWTKAIEKLANTKPVDLNNFL